ncbi:M48 family metallopeptidase [Nonomuraea sp. NPDC001636]|uniref:M48 family metallopeptidase n=1 Tax=Nonomuraea sp. NPDC001636 TaxID=3154391 RepID=UPI003321FE49
MSSSGKGWAARRQAAVVHGLHRDVMRAAREDDAARAGGSAGAARAAGYALAALVHLLPIAFLALGGYLVTRFTILSVPFGVIALDVAWLLRPRVMRVPGGAETLTRKNAPRLYELIDRIGDEVGAPRTDLVVLSGTANAAFTTYGWRRRRLVEIGYPLWMLLNPAERVSVIAHEMAHSRNGDARHGLVVGGALYSLDELREVTRFCWQPGDGLSRLAAECLLAVVGLPVRGLIVVLELLVHRSSQRAEYRADAIQARVGGTEAALSLMDALRSRVVPADHFLVTQTLAVGRQDLWAELRDHVCGLSETEIERLCVAAGLDELRVDRTHPPTHLRKEHLAALPYAEARVRAEAMEEIEEELALPAERVARGLKEDAQSALYY